jgi:hypothetical protein
LRIVRKLNTPINLQPTSFLTNFLPYQLPSLPTSFLTNPVISTHTSTPTCHGTLDISPTPSTSPCIPTCICICILQLCQYLAGLLRLPTSPPFLCLHTTYKRTQQCSPWVPSAPTRTRSVCNTSPPNLSSYQTTDKSPASPESKRLNMGIEEVLPSSTTQTNGTLVIHMAPGASVNTWGMYFEGMSGKSTPQATKTPAQHSNTNHPSQ